MIDFPPHSPALPSSVLQGLRVSPWLPPTPSPLRSGVAVAPHWAVASALSVPFCSRTPARLSYSFVQVFLLSVTGVDPGCAAWGQREACPCWFCDSNRESHLDPCRPHAWGRERTVDLPAAGPLTRQALGSWTHGTAALLSSACARTHLGSWHMERKPMGGRAQFSSRLSLFLGTSHGGDSRASPPFPELS